MSENGQYEAGEGAYIRPTDLIRVRHESGDVVPALLTLALKNKVSVPFERYKGVADTSYELPAAACVFVPRGL